MAIVNPFRTRHSEATATDFRLFTGTFAPEILHVVPPPPFEQFYVIRSAPGAGKTSLMKCLTYEILEHVHHDRTRLAHLATFLTDFGVLDHGGPRVLGVLENLDQNYGGLIDLSDDDSLNNRLLFQLIDSRVIQGVVRAALRAASPEAETDLASVEFVPTSSQGRRALERLGGTRGDVLLESAEAAEDELLDLYDQLVDTRQEAPTGHGALYSLIALSECEIYVAGSRLRAKPLIMLDDAHVLAAAQREALLGQMRNRAWRVGRWLAVRSVALADDDLLGAGDEGRDFNIIEIEALARERTSSSTAASKLVGQQLTSPRYRKMLLDIADRRASTTLQRILADDRSFTDLLTNEDAEQQLSDTFAAAAANIRDAIARAWGDQSRYSEWIQQEVGGSARETLARTAQLEVLIERDRQRAQGDLFEDHPLTASELATRGSSALRDAALLRASVKYRLPYYYGAESLARLGSANIEQFLELCGDTMARLLTQDATGRPLSLAPAIQDKLIREASRAYYNSLAQLPAGDHIKRLVDGVATIAGVEGAKPTIPYPPGVTGTALSMPDRARLRDAPRSTIPEMLRLHDGLRSAIAHNVVWIELGYRVKNQEWMVIYLNRLLCPHFNLPLGLGGLRERKLGAMMQWMVEPHLPKPSNSETLL